MTGEGVKGNEGVRPIRTRRARNHATIAIRHVLSDGQPHPEGDVLRAAEKAIPSFVGERKYTTPTSARRSGGVRAAGQAGSPARSHRSP
jgi:hypothetical protein